jgi:hypothetical protein
MTQVFTEQLRTPPIHPYMLRTIWEQAQWRPHSLQRKVALSKARQQVLAAGRRAGKSMTGGYKLVPEAFRAYIEVDELRRRKKRREYWIVGPEYSDAEKEFRVAWDVLEELGFNFDHPGSYNNPLAGEMRISLFKGRFIIHAKSAKYPGTLVGEGLSGIILSEAAKLKPSIYNKFLRATLADFVGWAFMSSTPEGRNWFYDFWMIGQDPQRPDWESWRAPAWSNPYVYPRGCDDEFIKKALEMRRKGRRDFEALLKVSKMVGAVPEVVDPEIWALFLDMSGEMFSQEIAALFTEYVGRVFKDFDEEIHVTSQEYRDDWTTYACVDYGFTNPFAFLLLQVDPHREHIHVIDEYYEVHKTTEQAAAEINSRWGSLLSNVRAFYPDPAEPDRTRTLASKLRIKPASPGSLSVDDRLEWMRRMLKPSTPHPDVWSYDGAPGLTIHRRCSNAIREFNVYRYKETADKAAEKDRNAPELPLKKDDHTPEALGRFFSGFFGSPWSQHAGPRQSRARVGR